MKFKAAAYSAKGIRNLNEDSFIISDKINKLAKAFTEISADGNDKNPCFFAVADGMGGQGNGEKVSSFVVSKLLVSSKNIKEFSTENFTELVNKIHNEISAQESKMGATLTGIVFQKNECGLFNLGDSRTYRLRDGFLLQMTNDDSLRRFDESAPSNIILNGIGAGLKNISVNCRFSEKIVIPNDRFLLCSDGVHGFVSDEQIKDFLATESSPKDIAANIVQKALQNGSDDNCTAIVVEFTD